MAAITRKVAAAGTGEYAVPGLEYVRADDVDSAVALVTADPGAAYLAGGTTQLDLLLKDRVIEARPARRHRPPAAARH